MWEAYILLVKHHHDSEWTILSIYEKGKTYEGKTAYQEAKNKRDKIDGIWYHAKVVKAVVLQV